MMAPTALHWRKLGRILNPEGRHPWMRSHAQNPTPLLLEDRIRVYFNTRPEPENGLTTSHPVYVDVARDDPTRVLGVAEAPVLTLGGTGCFDEHGCMGCSVVRQGAEVWLYYVGWKRCVAAPYDWAIGLAISRDGGERFERAFPGPVIGSSKNEPYLQNGCDVVRERDDAWRIWYSTGKEWLRDGDKLESRYVITSAHSTDGLDWWRTGEPILPERVPGETQTTPTLFRADGVDWMLFSWRHSTGFRNPERGYRIGCAWTEDGVHWQRDDALTGIDVSKEGWDAEMVCYPRVVTVDGRDLLFYCGNDFGRAGLGVAVRETEPA